MNRTELHAYARAISRRAETLSPRTAQGASSVVLMGTGLAALEPGCAMMFCGLRPGGGRADADHEWPLTQHLYGADSTYSSVLDHGWHGSPRGASSHQIAIQAIIAYLGGVPTAEIEGWLAGDQRPPEVRLPSSAIELVRSTPYVHLSPFRVEITDDEGLEVPEAERFMGWYLIEATRPQLLVCDGNGTPSAYSMAVAKHQVREGSPAQGIPRSYSIKRATIESGALEGTRVLGLPTLSQAKKTHVLRILEVLAGWGFRATADPSKTRDIG